MDVFRTDRIRNVVLLGHGGAGKTTIAEAMAYLAGVTNRLGRVEDGNTVSDYDKEEIKRNISITTSVVSIPWQKCKINVLDTPGFFDFVGEVEEAVSAADAAIIVVSGKAGVQVGTQKAWKLCEKYKLPRMIFVTDMDVDDVSYRKVVEELTELYGKKIAPLHFPIREDGKFVGYVNVVKQAGRKYIEKAGKQECEIPSYLDEYLEKYHDILMESVAETSEEFMDRYFEGDEFSVTEVSAALAMNVQEASIVPVCMGSPVNLRGVSNLLDDIVGYFPSPDKRACNGIAQKTNEIYQANYDFTKAKSAYVWKTIVDPFLGKYSLIKVCSGVIKSDDTLLNVEKGVEERLNKLYVLQGNKPSEVAELHAGDIGAIAKLNSVVTGDSMATKNNPIFYPKTVLSTPYTYKRYKAVKKGEEDKIAQALSRMMGEDLTLRAVNDAANRQTLLYGIGDQHLDTIVSKLKERYKVEIELSKPKVAFRETIRKNSDVEAKHKKQSGGHGQYGHVKMRFEPSGDMESGYVFEQVVVGGAVPKNYFPAVEKGLQECVQKGPVAAYPVVGVKATLYDGSYHPVDSSE
ncbi:MAG: elongation factor G, partial [Clostridiales bacterium]|nr:elongation factor G [Candidatus Blautia equi]